ncbi:MAG: TRAP transporter substrate-binding protein [SAR324 cluster bacterium]|nr:TRAP transporter substrate-binding protein [SAR324 cluster bacterium]
MERRHFVKAGLGAAAAAVALAGCEKKGEESKIGAPAVHTQKTLKWKMVTTWPKNFPALGTGANFLAETITKMSGGRIEVKVYGAGELVPAFECFDAVSKGTAEMGHGSPYYWKGKNPTFQFFSSVPFGLTALEMGGWMNHGGGQELWDQAYSDFNLKPFAAGNTGAQMGGWFNREINELKDFKGLKMRMPGLGAEVISELGATPVSLPGGEIFQSLQTGAIDATEWVGPYNDLAFGFHKIAKYYYWPGWHEPGTILEAFVNKTTYEGLPSDLQEIIRAACRMAMDQMLTEFNAKNNQALITLVKTHKVNLRKFSDESLEKLGVISQKVVEELGARDAFSKKVYASFNGFRDAAVGWDEIAETGFSLARSLTFKG